MHPSCVGEFEDVVNYDEWVGKVEGTYYCPMHHPWKDRIDDSEDEGSPKKLPAADNHESNVLETNQCDWRFSSLGCMYPELPFTYMPTRGMHSISPSSLPNRLAPIRGLRGTTNQPVLS